MGQIGYVAEHLKTARVNRGRERVRTREGDRRRETAKLHRWYSMINATITGRQQVKRILCYVMRAIQIIINAL